MKVLSRLWANHPQAQGSEWGATTRAPHSTSAPYSNVTVSLALGVWVLTSFLALRRCPCKDILTFLL